MSYELATSHYISIDAMRTHYLEAGNGPPVVLFHGGDFGGRAENAWGGNIDALAQRYRVIAPDWLGFGRTDKVHDFLGTRRRIIDHMGRFLEEMGLSEAHFIGNSMGATLLAMSVADGNAQYRPSSLVLASGGGFVPDNEFRRALTDYDCTMEGMVRLLKAVFSDPKWWTDEAYVRQRYEWSIEPGVWECCAAARFRAPHLPERGLFGQPDTTPYGNILCPTLVIAGDEDRLRLPGYADDLADRIPNSELHIFEQTGHCPNIERAEAFNSVVLDFLDRVTSKRLAVTNGQS